MRVVLQRCSRAEVRIDGETVGKIGKGFLLLVGITDGDTTAHGLDADFSVTGFTVDQPLEEAVTVKVTAKPTASDRAPVWV